jgi:hypothetical protein
MALIVPSGEWALANGQQVVKSFRYLLTDPCQFDILVFGPGWWGSDAI